MQKITSANELEKAILQLESDQKKQAGLLKRRFLLTAESLRPINLLRSAVEDFVRSPIFLMIGIDTVKSFVHRLIDLLFPKKEPADEQN